MNRLLSAYAHLMCRAIWAARRIFPAGEGETPDIKVARRDYEWSGRHVCENCGFSGRHKFIEWVPERVVTAECPRCGIEATLW